MARTFMRLDSCAWTSVPDLGLDGKYVIRRRVLGVRISQWLKLASVRRQRVAGQPADLAAIDMEDERDLIVQAIGKPDEIIAP